MRRTRLGSSKAGTQPSQRLASGMTASPAAGSGSKLISMCQVTGLGSQPSDCGTSGFSAGVWTRARISNVSSG